MGPQQQGLPPGVPCPQGVQGDMGRALSSPTLCALCRGLTPSFAVQGPKELGAAAARGGGAPWRAGTVQGGHPGLPRLLPPSDPHTTHLWPRTGTHGAPVWLGLGDRGVLGGTGGR